MKTSISTRDNNYKNDDNSNDNSDDNAFLLKVEDLISRKHWRSVLTASPSLGCTTAKQLAGNRGQKHSVLYSKYRAGAGARAGVRVKAKTSVSVSSKSKYTMFQNLS